MERGTAAFLKDYTTHKLTWAPELQERMQALSRENSWPAVMNENAYFALDGIRLPFCDKVSKPPRVTPERRPFVPLGVLRCHVGNDNRVYIKLELEFNRDQDDAITRLMIVTRPHTALMA